MTSPLVGSARVEITADLGEFGSQARDSIGPQMERVGVLVDEALAAIAASAGAPGAETGQQFGAETLDALRLSLRDLGVMLDRSLTEGGSGAGIAGARVGDRYADDLTTAIRLGLVGLGPEIAGELRVASAGAGEAGGRAGESFASRFRSTAATLVTGMGAVVAGAVAAGGALAGVGIKGAAALETTTTSFTALLGSSKLATQQIQLLQGYAAKTPFSQQDVLGYAQQYYALADSVGMSKAQVVPFLDAVGNLGAVTGASTESISNAVTAIGQIGSSGKVSLDNLNQISEAFPGFNGAAAIASATGQTTAQVMKQISAGSLDAKTGVTALVQGMQKFPGAAGAMQKQSETLSGLWSTFTDTIQIRLTQAFQPVIPIIKQALGSVTPIISSTLKTVAPAIASVIRGLAPVVGPLVRGFGTILTSVFQALGPVLRELAPAIQPLASAFASLVRAAAPLAAFFAQAIGTLLPPLARLFSGVLAAVSPLVSALVSALQPVLPIIASALSDVGAALQPLLSALGGAFREVIKALAPELPQLAKAAGQIAVALAHVLTSLTPLIPPLTKLLVAVIKNNVNSMLMMARAFTAVLQAVTPLIPPIVRLLNLALIPVTAAVRALGAVSRAEFAVVSGAVKGMVAAFQGARAGISAIVNGIRSALSAVGNAFQVAFTTAKHWLGNVVSAVRALPGQIVGLVTRVASAGARLMTGFWNGIKRGIGNVGGFIADIGSAIKNGINSFLHLPIMIPTINTHIPGVGTVGGETLIPALARGGLTTGPTLAMVGDNPSGSELVLPLDDPLTGRALTDAMSKVRTQSGSVDPSLRPLLESIDRKLDMLAPLGEFAAGTRTALREVAGLSTVLTGALR